MRLKLTAPPVVVQWFNDLEQRPTLAVAVSTLWLLLIGAIAYLWNLGNIGLIDETEPLFAEASRQMLVTGDWITPFFNGETRFDKPALIYWCQAIAYAIFGVNEWAARLPSALAAMGVSALAFYTLYWHFAQKDQLAGTNNPIRRYITSGIASAIMAFNAEMIVWGRVGVSDMLLTGCIASALLCFFLGYGTNSKLVNQGSILPNKWYLACYVLLAAGILTKGPVGIVLPGIIILAFVLYLGKFWEMWREMRPILGMLIVLALSIPWYALVIWRNGWNFINAFFGYHNIERFTEVVNGHSAPWFFYFLVVLLGFAPYSVFIPAAIVRLKFWRRSHWRNQERSQQLGLFVCFWFLGVFGFFTIAVTKLPSYVLPLMPAAAILVALLWSDLFPNPQAENTTPATNSLGLLRVSSWVNVGFLTVISVALFNLSHLVGPDPAAPDLYRQIQDAGLPTIGGVIWLSGAVIIAALILSRHWRAIIGINTVAFVAFLILTVMPALFFMDAQRQLPLRELSAVIVQEQQPNEELVMVGFKKPTVTFYTRKKVNYLARIDSSKQALEYIQQLTAQTVKPPSLLILAEQSKFVEMDLPPDRYKSIATKGAYHLIRVPLRNIKKEKTIS
ncbi:MAG TPA: glycosyltransferase family 39 protein [Nostocaceae cyanobacterium]|nr:glycosyltransferase family 39 protein [Nostocaceae cyanobacterium]